MDEVVECLSKHLEDKFLNQLIAAHDFTLMVDETMDMGNRFELAIFVRYIDSDSWNTRGILRYGWDCW